jgi:hypothetical protein
MLNAPGLANRCRQVAVQFDQGAAFNDACAALLQLTRGG